jgi:hypothetical protein
MEGSGASPSLVLLDVLFLNARGISALYLSSFIRPCLSVAFRILYCRIFTVLRRILCPFVIRHTSGGKCNARFTSSLRRERYVPCSRTHTFFSSSWICVFFCQVSRTPLPTACFWPALFRARLCPLPAPLSLPVSRALSPTALTLHADMDARSRGSTPALVDPSGSTPSRWGGWARAACGSITFGRERADLFFWEM